MIFYHSKDILEHFSLASLTLLKGKQVFYHFISLLFSILKSIISFPHDLSKKIRRIYWFFLSLKLVLLSTSCYNICTIISQLSLSPWLPQALLVIYMCLTCLSTSWDLPHSLSIDSINHLSLCLYAYLILNSFMIIHT